MKTDAVRLTPVRDIAEAGVDVADLLSTLRGIASPLSASGTTRLGNSWLHLPRNRPGAPEDLQTHLLRGHMVRREV